MSESPTQKPGSRVKRILVFFLKLLIATGIIAWLVTRDFNNFVLTMKSINYFWIIFAAAFYLGQFLVSAWRWRTLLKAQEIDVGYWELFSFTMQGSFFSLAIPAGTAGGDIVKAGMLSAKLPKGLKFEGIFSILMDRLTGLLGLCLLVIVATLINIGPILKIPGGVNLVTAIVLIVSMEVTIVLAVIFGGEIIERIPLLKKMKGFMDRLTKGAVTKLFEVVGSYSDKTRALLFCTLLSAFGIHTALALTMFFGALSLGEIKIPFTTTLLATTYGNLASSIPTTPLGIGTRDAVVKTILDFAQLHAGASIAIPIVYTVIVMLFSMSGGVFFLMHNMFRKPQEA